MKPNCSHGVKWEDDCTECERIWAENTDPVLKAPRGLHYRTKDLVLRFAVALAEKLHAAEEKYGYSDGWLQGNWMDECRAKLLEHVAKGDPRDVAAYCAFLWHHGESTARAEPADARQPDAPRPSQAQPQWVVCLRQAMNDAGLPSQYRADLIGYFCNAANAAPPAAVDEPLTNEHDQGGAVNFNYDIVKLLRGCVSPSLNSARQIMLKAAEEIERLRAPAAVGAVPADGCCLLDVKQGTPCAMTGFCLKESESAAVGELERAALVCDANAIKALRSDALQAAVAHDEDADAIRALAPVLDQVAVPKEIDRSKHQHALEVWNACMAEYETLESTWPKLVHALAIRASVPGEPKEKT